MEPEEKQPAPPPVSKLFAMVYFESIGEGRLIKNSKLTRSYIAAHCERLGSFFVAKSPGDWTILRPYMIGQPVNPATHAALAEALAQHRAAAAQESAS